MDAATKPTNNILMTFSTDFRVELGLGKVVPGKEAWMFGEYFPRVMAAFAEHQQGRLAGFQVSASNTQGVTPSMGSLNTWPSVETFARLLADPRFTELKPERDAALELLDDRHLLVPVQQEVVVDTENDYALVLSSSARNSALFSTPIADDSINRERVGSFLSLHRWSGETEALLSGDPNDAIVYRIRFDAPRA
ncbi:MAG: hypothetical protein K0V04_39575 [Deltaproteobacteria bacterium]|nr:hypothetical protein [Deltaproteobacteria bacterium]